MARHFKRTKEASSQAAFNLGLTLIVAVLSAVAVAVLLVPRLLGGTSLIVETGSMEPTIHPGDVVAIQALSPETIRAGDIITYATNKQLITHRVVGTVPKGQEKRLITQGDANNHIDEPIALEQVRGKVVYVIPKVGHVSVWVRHHPTVTLAIFGLALAAAVCSDWRNNHA